MHIAMVHTEHGILQPLICLQVYYMQSDAFAKAGIKMSGVRFGINVFIQRIAYFFYCF